MDRCRVRITADAAAICLLISHSILSSHVNKTPKYLNSSAWGRSSSLIRKSPPHFFLVKRWHSTSLELASVAMVPALSYHPKHTAPDPFGPCYRWWANIACDWPGLATKALAPPPGLVLGAGPDDLENIYGARHKGFLGYALSPPSARKCLP